LGPIGLLAYALIRGAALWRQRSLA
jgi:hypothetical protein